ncbi:MAG: alpha-amylase family glycosyl hydrolase, partial [Flavobacterium sp.]|nr:alpha-amylase family glycosyl hydrolase [Flavobacterium sp.]
TLKNVFTANGNPASLYTTHTNEYSSIPSGKRKLRFTTNHDLSNEQTPLSVFGSKKAAEAASVATLLMNGTPLIYSGQEVGVNQPSIYLTGQPINWNANADMLEAYTAMLQFYKNSDVARKGTITYYNNSDCIVFEKKIGNDKLLIIINSRSTTKTASIPNNLQGNWKNALLNQSVTISENVQLNGYEYLILKSVN